MDNHKQYIKRCIQLAKLGLGMTQTNPLVGAVLVYNNLIIGEGFHEKFGEAHAEVNCLKSVMPKNKTLIPNATLYINLEPCSHSGKTPPCAHAIVKAGVKKVIVGTLDINPLVSGKGIEYLRNNGVKVEVGFMEADCYKLNKVFFTLHEKKRTYIKLKWSASANGYIGQAGKQIFISNDYVNMLNHKYRTRVDAILVGYNTALIDQPQLTSRHWQGQQPIRIFIDWQCKLEPTLINLAGIKSLVFNLKVNKQVGDITYHKVEKNANAISKKLLTLGIASVLVEGGAKTHQLFINDDCWDEAIIINANNIISNNGIPTAQLNGGHVRTTQHVANNTIYQISNSKFLK